jgi:hypothetical protein
VRKQIDLNCTVFSPVLHCTVLYCTVLYYTILYCIVLYCTILYCTALYCIVLHCTVLHCTILYCTVLCCTTLHCTVPYCTVLCCTFIIVITSRTPLTFLDFLISCSRCSSFKKKKKSELKDFFRIKWMKNHGIRYSADIRILLFK